MDAWRQIHAKEDLFQLLGSHISFSLQSGEHAIYNTNFKKHIFLFPKKEKTPHNNPNSVCPNNWLLLSFLLVVLAWQKVKTRTTPVMRSLNVFQARAKSGVGGGEKKPRGKNLPREIPDQSRSVSGQMAPPIIPPSPPRYLHKKCESALVFLACWAEWPSVLAGGKPGPLEKVACSPPEAEIFSLSISCHLCSLLCPPPRSLLDSH